MQQKGCTSSMRCCHPMEAAHGLAQHDEKLAELLMQSDATTFYRCATGCVWVKPSCTWDAAVGHWAAAFERLGMTRWCTPEP